MEIVKLELTKDEYTLIRHSLVDHYYLAKDGGDKNRMNNVVKLEEKITDQYHSQ